MAVSTDPDVARAGRAVAWLARQFEVELGEAGLSLPQFRLLASMPLEVLPAVSA